MNIKIGSTPTKEPKICNPDIQDPNEVAAFVHHSSKSSASAVQVLTDVTPPHTHPKLGQVVTISIDAAIEGKKSNTVILHLPIKTLAQWVTGSFPDTPKVGSEFNATNGSLDFSNFDLDKCK